MIMPLMQVFSNSSDLAGNVNQWQYCPCCGTKLAGTSLKRFERQCCLQCGAINYLNPTPGITMLIRSPERLILIGKRAATARYGGKWCLPGGYIEYEESFIETAWREIGEETGLQVRIEGVVNVVSNQLDDWHHTLVVVLVGDMVAGEPRAGDDLVELQWVDKAGHEAASYAFEADRRIIDGYFAGCLPLLPLDQRYAGKVSAVAENQSQQLGEKQRGPILAEAFCSIVKNNRKTIK